MRRELVNVEAIRAADQWALDHGHPAAPLELLAAYGAVILREAELGAGEVEVEVGVDAAMRVVRLAADMSGRADPLCVYPDGICTCGEPEGHRDPTV